MKSITDSNHNEMIRCGKRQTDIETAMRSLATIRVIATAEAIKQHAKLSI